MRVTILTIVVLSFLTACSDQSDGSKQKGNEGLGRVLSIEPTLFPPADDDAAPAADAAAPAAIPAAPATNQPSSVEQAKLEAEAAKAKADADARAKVAAYKMAADNRAQAEAAKKAASEEKNLEAQAIVDGVAMTPPANQEKYAPVEEHLIKLTAKEPISTFSIDVDTGSYSNVRRLITAGQMPPKEAVRVEELINYFPYDYPIPLSTKQPFGIVTEIASTPWNAKTKLLHIGIKGYQLPANQLPPANLVFLIDVSGSMESPNKLPLIQAALKELVQNLSKQDRISIVVYANSSRVVLEPTSAKESEKINEVIDQLQANGGTNGGEGIKLAYDMASKAFIKNGTNRVILATDGDFNVGMVNFEELLNLIIEKRKSGISLTTLGVGTDDYNEKLMEQAADAGNGNYAYLDNLNEARKVLIEQKNATLHTIANDVKIQIEFNPDVVSEYRLIGYENRDLKREDFTNDKVDAGEVGAGHSVTALYEIALTGQGGERLESLRYAKDKKAKQDKKTSELAFLRLRYKTDLKAKSQLLETALSTSQISSNLQKTSNNFRYAAAVAAFGQLLRGGQFTENFTYDDVRQLAEGARGEDGWGYRADFLRLVDLTKALVAPKTSPINR